MLNKIKCKLLKTFFSDAVPVHSRNHLSSNCHSNRLMIVLGWGGSTRKNLQKIEKFHLDNGFSTITCTMPLFVPSPLRRYINNEVVDIIKEHVSNNDKDIYYHVYSNNGSWMYSELMRKSDLGEIPYPIKTVFDSAAYLPSDDIAWYKMVPLFSRPLVAMILKKAVYTHPILTPLIVSLMFPFALSAKILQFFSGDIFVPNYSEMNNYLQNKLEIPSLFIYSTGDTLVPVLDIESFICSQTSRNISTEIWKVEDLQVQHTATFFMRNEEYGSKLKAFLSSSSFKSNNL